jgi:hypothetical protein
MMVGIKRRLHKGADVEPMSPLGPGLQTCALQQVGSYLGYTVGDPDMVERAAVTHRCGATWEWGYIEGCGMHKGWFRTYEARPMPSSRGPCEGFFSTSSGISFRKLCSF